MEQITQLRERVQRAISFPWLHPDHRFLHEAGTDDQREVGGA